MGIAAVIEYNSIINCENWTVETLNTKLMRNQEHRIALTDLFYVNKLTLKELNLPGHVVIPYIEVKNVDAQERVLKVSELELMSVEELPTRGRFIGRPGDIIVSAIRPERGSIAILPEDYEQYVVSSNFFVLTPIELPSEVLYFVLSDESVLNEFGGLAGGSTIPTMNLKQLKEYEIREFDKSIPMFNEAISLYKRLDHSVKNSMSMSMAADAVFRNELLVDDSRNKELPKFKTINYGVLTDRFDVEYLISLESQNLEWSVITRKIKEIALVENAPSKSTSNEYFSKNIPLIQTKDLKNDKIYINSDEVEYVITEEDKVRNTRYLYPTDIVIAKIGGDISKSSIVPSDLTGAISSANAYVIRNVYGEVLTEYLALFLRTTMAQDQVEAQIKAGATMKMLKLSMLKELEIPVPNIELQKNIVNRIHELADGSNKKILDEDIKVFKKMLLQ